LTPFKLFFVDPLVKSSVDSGQHPKGGETANRKSFTIALFKQYSYRLADEIISNQPDLSGVNQYNAPEPR